MIAQESLELFGQVLDALPRLAPPDALITPRLPPAQEQGFLSPQAMPPDPDHCAIVAVIDHAIPFAHRLFRAPTGHSRMAAIWLQDAPARDRRPDIAFGQELRGRMIDALGRDEDEIYRASGLMDAGRGHGLLRAASHGAGVAALAAGFAAEDVASLNHPMIAVSLPDFGVADTSGSLSALFIQAAVVFVIARARALARDISQAAGRTIRPPLVVNLSLGITAGGRDGSSLISRLQNAISQSAERDLGPVHFVLPTGNSRQDRGRAVLAQGQDILWHLPPDDRTPSALEIWGMGPGLPVTVTLPDGQALTINLPAQGGIGRIQDDQGRELARLTLQNRAMGPIVTRPCMTLIVPPTLPDTPDQPSAPPGAWRIQPTGPGPFELIVLRDDSLSGFGPRGRQSRLVDPDYQSRQEDGHWPGADDASPGKIRRNGTSSSYAGGQHQIRVGATLTDASLAPYTGLLESGLPGDVTAPADAALSVRGLILPGMRAAARQRLSGTSLSAPQITRWLAGELASGRPLPDRAAIVAAVGPGDCPDLGVPQGLPWRTGLD
jgi:hypothetical protein